MKLEEKENLRNTIQDLGFREERDYNGRMVLKNNVPIKKTMNFDEVENLVGRLRKEKRENKTEKLKLRGKNKK